MTTKTKERGLIVSDWEANAIRKGRKTQARRVIAKLPTEADEPQAMVGPWCTFHYSGDNAKMFTVRSPFGQPGDRLYLRESWQRSDLLTEPESDAIAYRADCAVYSVFWNAGDVKLGGFLFHNEEERDRVGWKSCAIMPEWAARTLVELVSVRVERLQDASIVDIGAEGHIAVMTVSGKPVGGLTREAIKNVADAATRKVWADAWDKTNAKKGNPWESNPWVWVPEFKVIEGAA